MFIDYRCTVLTPMYSKMGRIQLTKSKMVFYDNLTSVEDEPSEVSNAMIDFFTYKKR